MKIAIGLRTCGSVYNYWNQQRIVKDDKPTILLTCLNSLLKTIKKSKHEIIFSVHDDNTNENLLKQIDDLIKSYDVTYELIHCGKLQNFKSQYEWVKKQDCDYVYYVEDDYLHVEDTIDDMVNICEDMKAFHPGEYAVFPMNHPHRYHSFGALNLVYVLRGRNNYWRNAFHSTATFFMSKPASLVHDDILKYQAYTWEIDGAPEDKTINKLWNSQQVRLLYPIRTLAWHISDESNRDIIDDWEKVWRENYYEAR